MAFVGVVNGSSADGNSLRDRDRTDEFKSLFAFLHLAGTSLLDSQADAILFVRSFRHWKFARRLTVVEEQILCKLNAPQLRGECRSYRILAGCRERRSMDVCVYFLFISSSRVTFKLTVPVER